MPRSRQPPQPPQPRNNHVDYDLQELVPSPMPDSPTELRTQPYSLNSAPSIPPSISTSNGPTRLVRWLNRSQKYSSYAFTSFLGLHFATTAVAPLVSGMAGGDNALMLSRVFYQTTPVIEATLIPGSLLIHSLSGLTLRIVRHRQTARKYGSAPPFWTRENFTPISITGYLLMPLITAHSVLTRVIPLYADGDSSEVGLGLVSHGFEYHGTFGRWVSSLYYAGFIGLASFHVIHGWGKWLRIRNKRRTNAAVAVVSVAWLSGLFAVIARAGSATGYLAKKYDIFYAIFFRRLQL